MRLSQVQTFLLALVLIVAGVVLYVAGYPEPGMLALGAGIGTLGTNVPIGA